LGFVARMATVQNVSFMGEKDEKFTAFPELESAIHPGSSKKDD
jgi:hypothetical protein